MKRFTLVFFALLSVSLFAQKDWIRYASISPDAAQIVFAYQGDLFLVSSDGGTAQPLLLSEAYESNPVWSNDGKKLAYTSDLYGNFDIFIFDFATRESSRITYHSAKQVPWTFSPDDQFVIFSATLDDNVKNAQFPYGLLTELYKVPVTGGRVKQCLTTSAENVNLSKDGMKFLYQDVKGYEDPWRKHHISSVTRDIWMFDKALGKHTQISTFKGEDRNPVYAANEEKMFFLSEQNGTFNVFEKALTVDSPETQLTNFELHPVRFLSIADNNTLSFIYNGGLYTKNEGADAKKLSLTIPKFKEVAKSIPKSFSKEATEMNVAPNGKEVVFVVRGEVFVTSVEFGTTKRITNTPEQERNVSFSPDGKSILYSSERNGSWNIYETSLVNAEEESFALSTVLKEKPIVANKKNTFQPEYSPDGKEIAFLEERTELKVINLASKAERTVLAGTYNFSYSDGDQWYQWSPDGKYFLVNYLGGKRWVTEVGLVDAMGGKDPINLSLSGYADSNPKWIMDGNGMLWFSDRMGMRSHGSWGSKDDAFAMFFNQEFYEKFTMSKEEYEAKYDKKKDEDKDKPVVAEVSKKKKSKDTEEKKEEKSVEMNLTNLEDRVTRLTIHSSDLSDAVLTKDGKNLFYLSRFEKGFDLWLHKIKEKETKLVLKLNGKSGRLKMDKDGKNLFLLSGGSLIKLDIKNVDKPVKKNIAFKADMDWNAVGEREYIFHHAWKQVNDKFYAPDFKGVDWELYKKAYEAFLPSISNNYDFAELLGEMLGELNGSHTGGRYRHQAKGDATASLGAFYDLSFVGKGLKITEIIEKGPLDKSDLKIAIGDVIEQINGVDILPEVNFYQLLNQVGGKNTQLRIYHPTTQKSSLIVMKPISQRAKSGLLYDRWIKFMREETDRLSDGKVGYVHIKGMNDASFRVAYSEILGRNVDKESIVVDTRFNGGGWLHDDLVTLLSGERYVDFAPRGRYVGSEPMEKWYRPSIVLMGEGNYSDAHAFPYAYKALKIGKLVGMPVPGTMTAVWWERQIDPSLVFGIPQMGVWDLSGNYLENQQLEPDVMVAQDKEKVSQGIDQQLMKAVEILLQK
ncbi:MAG: S41 family peptidase [Bacteroidales bacterium]|jgi:tricorn protease|nr:S41 family peptidase [Bacteroidales bacterium]